MLFSGLCQLVAQQIALGQGAANGHAHDVLRVIVGKEAAAAVTCRVQALNGVALSIQHLHLGVDAQTVQRAHVPKTIVDVLKKDGAPIRECVQKINDRLHIVTSIIDLAPMEMEMLSRASREKILDRALKPIKDSYDYILIDCPPQLSILTINALSCADGVLIPVKTDYLAYRGLTQLQDSIREIQELINPDLKVLGVIATLYDARVSDDKDILALLKEEYNLVGVVKRLAVAKKGIYDGLAVVEQAPSSEIAKEYTAIAKMIINGNFDREDIENG